jgi:hypothetical protein
VNDDRGQNYHDAQIGAEGLRSPLLDVLNVRYVVVPRSAPSESLPVVFEDAQVRVLERASASPRAWLTHDVRVAPADAALTLLATGTIDPRQTVVLEADPGLEPSPSDGGDRVVQQSSARFDVSSDAPGVLVMSEVSYPGWTAYVDGQRSRMLLADGLLHAVAVPAGAHTVDVRYESAPLAAGLAISSTTILGIALLCMSGHSARRASVGCKLAARTAG